MALLTLQLSLETLLQAIATLERSERWRLWQSLSQEFEQEQELAEDQAIVAIAEQELQQAGGDRAIAGWLRWEDVEAELA